jgi:type IV pilus assembly protein PilN
MSTLTTVRAGTSPRINLLPPEIIAEDRFRKVRAGLALAVVASVGVVSWLFVLASHDATQAKVDLDAAQAQKTVLDAQAAQYADVPTVGAQVDAAKAQLAAAMGQEVRWSFYLNDLSLRIPSGVWLTNMHAEASAPSAAAPAAATGPLPTGIGQLTFAGTAYNHNDVAAWLEALAKQKGFASPYFTSASDTKIGAENAVTFDSSVVLTADALSRRFTSTATEEVSP